MSSTEHGIQLVQRDVDGTSTLILLPAEVDIDDGPHSAWVAAPSADTIDVRENR